MKRAAAWTALAAGIVFVIAWGVMGVKIFSGDFDVLPWVYTGAGAYVVLMIALLYRAAMRRCPHCGKRRHPVGKYCPWCGREV